MAHKCYIRNNIFSALFTNYLNERYTASIAYFPTLLHITIHSWREYSAFALLFMVFSLQIYRIFVSFTHSNLRLFVYHHHNSYEIRTKLITTFHLQTIHYIKHCKRIPIQYTTYIHTHIYTNSAILCSTSLNWFLLYLS